MRAVADSVRIGQNGNGAPCGNTKRAVETLSHGLGATWKPEPTTGFSQKPPRQSSGAMPMNPPHPSAANRERLLTIMRVCHRLRQPLPPRTRLAPLVGCTSRQLHRYIERLKAEGLVALERSGRGLLVQEIGR
jgi:hypothetical protein